MLNSKCILRSIKLFTLILLSAITLQAQGLSVSAPLSNALFSNAVNLTEPRTPRDEVEDQAFRLLLKTSPLDFIIGRAVIALEYQLSAKGSVELTGLYDDIENIQLLHHEFDYGRMVHFNLRYKHYFGKHSSSFVTGKGILGGGFFAAIGTSYGRMPQVYNPTTFVDRFVAFTGDERSTIAALTTDLGFSHKLSSKFNLEYFIGAEIGRSTNSVKYLDDDSIIIGPGLWKSGRLGIRLGYYLL